MIVGGLAYLGRVDESRAGHVVTRFAHLWLVPFVPSGSFFVTPDGHAAPIPLSSRSVFAAYARGWGTVLLLVCAGLFLYRALGRFYGQLEIYTNGGAAVTRADLVDTVTELAILAAGAALGLALILVARTFRRPTAARTAQLARFAGAIAGRASFPAA
jgi:hypothetical protein